MEVVGQDGKRTPIAPSKNFKLDHEASRSGESLLDVTRRKGYAVDPGTVEAVRKWNPKVESTINPLRAGETLTFVRPVENVEPDAKLAVVPGARPLTPLVFTTQRAEIAKVRMEVQKTYGQPQLSAQQHQRLQVATDKIERANAVFEARATTMSPRQQALAAVQIEAATAQIRTAAVSASVDRPDAVLASAAIAADAETFAKLLSSGPRKLRVVVRSAPSGKAAEPLAVYVLPLGLVRYGPSTDETKLRNLIGVLTFSQPTSPSLGDVEPGVKYAVWVGPRHSVDLMAKLVKNGSVKKYVPVDATPASLADVIFDEADQIRAP
ncbi:hypothetical protein [Variovorax sp. LjRoot130]